MERSSLASLLPTRVTQYLDRLSSALTGAQTDIGRLQKAGYVTGKQVPQFVDPTFIRQQLQANGSAALNVTNLIGKLASPQTAGAPEVASLPPFNSPLAQDGTLVRFNGLLYFYDGSTDPGSWKPVSSVGAVLLGTHAQRISALYTPPTIYVDGTVFYETDRDLLYIVRGGVWVYLWGIYRLAYGSIAALALTSADTNLRIFVNDYDHTILWTGAVWGWAEWDRQGGQIEAFAVDPNNSSGGYQLCDGSSTTQLVITAGALSTPTFNTPNLVASPAYGKFGSPYTGTINPAVAAAIGGSPGITTSSAQAGTGASFGFVNGVNAGTLANNTAAEPANLVLRPWFRR